MYDFELAKKLVQDLHDSTLEREAQLRMVLQEAKAAEDRLKTLEETKGILAAAREVLTAIAKAKRVETTQKIEDLVTSGIRDVWGDQSLKLSIKEKATKKRFNWVFSISDNGYETEDITETRGGGMQAALSFLLTVVLTVMLDKKQTRFFVFDEKFAHLSSDNLPAMGALIAELGKSLGLQVLLVSHQPEIEDSADRVYQISKGSDGVASAKRVR